MKNSFLKYSILTCLMMSVSLNKSFGQNVGGTNSNQCAPTEVKASELSKGAYTSDVNLFTGTMATSYDLGTVSTFAGLSYNLQLNYSSTKSVGQNPGLIRGLSYGDGWNVNIPTISVTVEAYRNIVQQSGQYNCRILTKAQGLAEGSLSWFAPFINIPGVVSERFILKTIDTLRNELVFVPNVMDKYIEARLRNGSNWTVTNNNGDVYIFQSALVNLHTAPQLNYLDSLLKDNVGLRQDNLVPKEMPLTWFCNIIYNKNHPLNQQIAFQYENYGRFDFYEEFKQPRMNQILGMEVGNALGFSPFIVAKDMLLIGIESYSDRGSIEKIELDYKTILPPSNLQKNMLLISDNSVRRLDSLYNYRIVFSQGVDSPDDSSAVHSYGYNTQLSLNYGLNVKSPDFTNWRRYIHIMSNKNLAKGNRFNQFLSNAFLDPNNPYLFHDSQSSVGQYIFEDVQSQAPFSELPFDHGFLESPRIVHDIVPGDIYQVKSYIKDYNVTDPAKLVDMCNFDINVVSGTGNGSGTPAINKVRGDDFTNGSRGYTVFTTFNNPVKWTSLAYNSPTNTSVGTVNGLIPTSNFFLMPALPATFNGINVQIGPANSDHDYSLDFQSNDRNYMNLNHTGASLPSSYDAFKYLQNTGTALPQHHAYDYQCIESPYVKPQVNFGIGLPWYMMNEVYTKMSNDPSHPDQLSSGNYRFWWRDPKYMTLPSGLGDIGSGVSSYPNVPTAADNNVKLAAFELIRYSRNPYMLYRVRKFKYNGYNYTDSIQKNKYVVNQLNFAYNFKVDSLFSYSYFPQPLTIVNDTTIGCTTYNVQGTPIIISTEQLLKKNFIGFQNVYLLETIKQIPVNGALANAPTAYIEANVPTTHFYYSKMNSGNLIGKGTRLNFTGNIYLINKIVDQLGGTMQYEFYPLSDGRHTRFTDIYINNNYNVVPFDHYNLPSPKTYKVQIVVKEKKYFNSATAVLPVKTWQYEYSDDPVATHCNDGVPGLGKNRIPDTGPTYLHESQDIDFGFLITTIKYPQLNSNTNVPYDRYTHFNNSENRSLTFGKLKKVEKFDAGGQILSKKEYEYKASMAFGNFLYTGNQVVSDLYNVIDREYTSNYNTNSPNYAFSSTARINFYEKCHLSDAGRDIGFLEMRDLGKFQNPANTSTVPNCYFVRLVKETNTDYDYTSSGGGAAELAANPLFRGINLGDNNQTPEASESSSGINSLKLETSRLTSANPTLLMRNALPFRTVNQLTTITEYEYWDADSMGITESLGFEQLLNDNATIQGSTALYFEPSFELFKTKTYSPHLPNAFTSTENYYYWDLKEDIKQMNPSGIYPDPYNFDALKYTHKYGIRNLMYQKRITSKAATQNAIAKSEYYWYDTRTLTDTSFFYDTLYIDFEYCQPASPQDSTGNNNGNPWTPDPTPTNPVPQGCYQIPHPFELPDPGYTFTEVNPGDWWYCPADGDLAQRNAARYLNLPSDMKTKLMLRRIDEQIDTIQESLTYFNKYHPILRFKELFRSAYPGGPLNIPLNEYGWFTPYKTKTKYRTLEHTPFGQVRLEMNERGLKTRYEYQTVFSTTFIDNVSNCPTNAAGAYNLTDQGVPKSITVGSGLPDSLTTYYTYNKDYTINSIVDPNGMRLSYQYDDFSRMTVAVRNNEVLSVNQYSQWLNDTALSYEQRANQNYVESYILLNSGSTIAEHSRAYIDPLGRKYDVQTQVTSNYTNPNIFDTLMVHSGLTTYDNWDRVLQQYKPFKRTNAGSPVIFSPQFNPTASFTEQQYEGNQRGRVLRASKFGESINTGHTINSSYQIITGLQLKLELGASFGNANINELAGVQFQNQLQFQRYLKTSSIDEDSKKTVSYTNALGQKVATKTYANSISKEITGFVYDSQGNLKKVINPKLQKTTYEYNLSGNMFRKVSVDADTVKYLYDVSGNVVLEQDANGKHGRDEQDGKLYMRKYTYDIFGRLIEQDRVHYNPTFDPLLYRPFIYGYNSGVSDTTKAFYKFSNTATLDFFGGWIVEKCTTGGLVYRQTIPTGNVGPINPINPGFDPEPNDPGNPPTNPCSMIYGYFGDSLTLSAPEKKWAYHFPIDATDPEIAGTTLSSITAQNNLNGRLSIAKSYSHDGTFSNLNIYSYNNVGLIEKDISQFNQVGGVNVFTSIINYTHYNLRNSLLEQEIDANADGIADITYRYVYDGWNRLRIVRQKQTSNTFTVLATYNYDDALGLVTNTKYYNPLINCNPLIDSIAYKYDTRNRLTQLNSKLYNERLFYDANLPIASPVVFTPIASRNFNGNINGLIHSYKLNTTANYLETAGIMDSSTVYGYTYDGLNRLKHADASVLNVVSLASGPSVYTPRLKFGDEAITYDAIGNIETLDRGLYYNPSVPTPVNASQNWNYNYPASNNHLIHIDSLNIPQRNYQYNQNGSSIAQNIGKTKNSTDYMRSNLPRHAAITDDTTGVYNVANVYYEYNTNDDRVYKEILIDRGAQRYYYLRDASGKEVAELDITSNTWKYYAYGRERIAELDRNYIHYFTYDHLGSVKIVYSTDNACASNAVAYTTESSNDNYSFGKALRSFNGGNKFGYQGSEREIQLSDNDYYTHFRGLDVEIARWKQIDPVFSATESPYASMGNNPVCGIDPLGNTVDDFFKNKAGDIVWDNSRSSSIKRNGEDYQNIGSALNIVTVSYIEGPNEGGNDLPVPLVGRDGYKLTTYTRISGNYNDDGSFNGFSYSDGKDIGSSFGSPLLKGASGVPGTSNISYGANAAGGGYGVYIEQHTEVNWKEKPGLLAMGTPVDVNQALYMNISKTGEFSMNISHGVYPSVKSSVNGTSYYKYAAQSFINSHAPRMKSSGMNRANAMFQQSSSDYYNTIYRTSNKAVFSGFTSAPFGTSYSSLKW